MPLNIGLVMHVGRRLMVLLWAWPVNGRRWQRSKTRVWNAICRRPVIKPNNLEGGCEDYAGDVCPLVRYLDDCADERLVGAWAGSDGAGSGPGDEYRLGAGIVFHRPVEEQTVSWDNNGTTVDECSADVANVRHKGTNGARC